MTKIKQSLVNGQMNLFELLSQERDERAATAPGRLNITARINVAIRQALKSAPKSRETIADDMTDLTGETVTVSMLNNWTSESHPHEMPGRFYAAFCSATGDYELLRIQAEAAGLFTVKGPDALRVDLQKKVESKRRADKEIRQIEALIKALEGGRP